MNSVARVILRECVGLPECLILQGLWKTLWTFSERWAIGSHIEARTITVSGGLQR